MPQPLIRAAIAYDFDGTLCPGYMQEYSYIPELGIPKGEFWEQSNRVAKEQDADNILAYMYMMVKLAKDNRFTLDDLRRHGGEVKLYPGVEEWFTSLNEYAASLGIELSHYIISSGIKEIIEGTSIAGHFSKIYASSFIYDRDKVPVWPALAVNYTTKTQFLFRISKGAFELYDDTRVNDLVKPDTYHTPFRNMIFIGDGETDIPSMRLIKEYHGKAIAVYDPEKQKQVDVAQKLLKDGRVNTIHDADYREGQPLHEYVKSVLSLIASNEAVLDREAGGAG